MNLPTIQVKPSYDPLPVGTYNARVSSIETESGQYGVQVKFTFELTDPAHSGRRLTGYARVSESMQSKLVKWVNAIQARPLQLGEVINWQALLNRPVQLVVLLKQKPDGAVYNRVEDLLPAPAQPVQAQATPVAPAQPVYPQATPAPVQAQVQPQATPAQPVQATAPPAQGATDPFAQ